MIAIYVISAILILITAIALLPASFTLRYRYELSAEIGFLGKNHRLYPKEKKEVKISDYSLKKIKKRRKKADKKKQKSEKKKKQTVERTDTAPKKSPSLLENLGLIKELLLTLIPKTAKRVKIKASRIIINLATGDAASTALLYPAVNGAVYALVSYLDNEKKFVGLDKSTIAVNADFISEKTTADIEISFSLRVWHIGEILFATALKYVKQKFTKMRGKENG